MKQKLCILFFFGLICLGLQAQTHVVLKTKAGGIQNIGLNTLKNVTFTEDNIIFNYASGSNLPYLSSTVSLMTFAVLPNAINETLDNKEQSFIYPNPTKDVLYVNSQFTKPTNCLIYHIDGRLVMSVILDIDTQSFNVSSLSNGFYLLKMDNQVYKFRKL